MPPSALSRIAICFEAVCCWARHTKHGMWHIAIYLMCVTYLAQGSHGFCNDPHGFVQTACIYTRAGCSTRSAFQGRCKGL